MCAPLIAGGDMHGIGVFSLDEALVSELVDKYGKDAVRKQSRSVNVDFGVVVDADETRRAGHQYRAAILNRRRDVDRLGRGGRRFGETEQARGRGLGPGEAAGVHPGFQDHGRFLGRASRKNRFGGG